MIHRRDGNKRNKQTKQNKNPHKIKERRGERWQAPETIAKGVEAAIIQNKNKIYCVLTKYQAALF